MNIQAVKPRIAIIGAGISGLGAAYALKDSAEITIFEKRDRPGGHANTVEINYDGQTISVDTGFIVFNELTYPNFCPLLDELGVASHESDMSFSFALEGGVEWSSNKEGLFAQKRNFMNIRHLKMLRDILRFNSLAQRELAENRLGDRSLGQWLKDHGFDRTFQHRYILPMGAAIWSSSDAEISQVSAASFIRFFRNHRLMHAKRPKWRTVTGGSHSYVRAILAAIGEDRVQYGARIAAVERVNSGVEIRHEDGQTQHFDHVIMALHADDALGLVEGLGEHERHLLEAFPYSRNKVYLHRDTALMPTRKKAWAAWNAMAQREGGAAAVSYWMNTLQGIDDKAPLFVTLNAHCAPDPALTFGEYDYNHPQFSPASDEAQARFAAIQGNGGLWYAGAWLGYGFHEDGLRTGLQVGRALGGHVGFDIADSDAPYNLNATQGEQGQGKTEAISA
jgi:predicted NAD/FAD-binding protein